MSLVRHGIFIAQSLEIWDKADLMDIIHLGPDSPDDHPDGNLQADQYPDPNKARAQV